MHARLDSTLTEVGPASNNGKHVIDASQPYTAHVTIKGASDLLFHAWSCEAVDEKAKAAKNSKAKKSDNLESYVQRNDKGEICLPGEYLRQAVIHAAKFRSDPRSPRKSAMDLFKAGVVSTTVLASLGKTTWDFEHKCRVMIQRNGITRTRPAFKAGWQCEVSLLVLVPEYIPHDVLLDVLCNAGKLIGVGDFRPTYGRFQVTNFEMSQ